MRQLALAFLFCLHSIANAQNSVNLSKPVACFPTLTLLSALKETYNEEPIVMGKHGLYEDTVTAVYVNPAVGTYTVIEMNKTMACLISIGTELRFREPKKGPGS